VLEFPQLICIFCAKDHWHCFKIFKRSKQNFQRICHIVTLKKTATMTHPYHNTTAKFFFLVVQKYEIIQYNAKYSYAKSIYGIMASLYGQSSINFLELDTICVLYKVIIYRELVCSIYLMTTFCFTINTTLLYGKINNIVNNSWSKTDEGIASTSRYRIN
jgi:hypothetical protein